MSWYYYTHWRCISHRWVFDANQGPFQLTAEQHEGYLDRNLIPAVVNRQVQYLIIGWTRWNGRYWEPWRWGGQNCY